MIGQFADNIQIEMKSFSVALDVNLKKWLKTTKVFQKVFIQIKVINNK